MYTSMLRANISMYKLIYVIDFSVFLKNNRLNFHSYLFLILIHILSVYLHEVNATA